MELLCLVFSLTEVAQEASSNEEEYRPDKMPSLIPDSESMEAVIGKGVKSLV